MTIKIGKALTPPRTHHEGINRITLNEVSGVTGKMPRGVSRKRAYVKTAFSGPAIQRRRAMRLMQDIGYAHLFPPITLQSGKVIIQQVTNCRALQDVYPVRDIGVPRLAKCIIAVTLIGRTDNHSGNYVVNNRGDTFIIDYDGYLTGNKAFLWSNVYEALWARSDAFKELVELAVNKEVARLKRKYADNAKIAALLDQLC